MTLLYVKARSERGRQIFTPTEMVLCAAIVIGAIFGIYGLWSGNISI